MNPKGRISLRSLGIQTPIFVDAKIARNRHRAGYIYMLAGGAEEGEEEEGGLNEPLVDFINKSKDKGPEKKDPKSPGSSSSLEQPVRHSALPQGFELANGHGQYG